MIFRVIQRNFLFFGSSIATVLCALFLQNSAVGLFCFLIWIMTAGALIGPRVAPLAIRWVQTILGSIITLSVFSILGTAIFWLTPMPFSIFILLFLVTSFLVFLLRAPHEHPHHEKEATPKGFFLAATAVVGCFALFWTVISQTQIIEAVRGPWEVLSPTVLFAFFLAALLLAFLFASSSHSPLLILLFAVLFFSGISLTAVLYPLGYGFDPFIHEATVLHIFEHGTITPKPLYYLGQYVLELGAMHLFSLPLDLVNRFLAPILATVLLTTSGFVAFSSCHKSSLALFSLFLLPLSAFISTTPQALAYMLTTSLILLSLPRILKKESPVPFWVLGILVLAILCLHPLAGIPALWYFFALLMTSKITHTVLRRTLLIMFSLIGAISIPLVFLLQATITNLPVTVSFDHLFDISRLSFPFFFENFGNPLLDFFYLLIGNGVVPIAILAGIGLFLMRKETTSLPFLPLIGALVCFLNYWFLSTTLEFSFLIEYERQDYALRLLTLTSIFLLPLAGLAIARIDEKLTIHSKTLRSSFLFLLALCLSAQVYGAYPRDDNYARSSGFNVTQDDFNAVWSIEANAEERPYIVLANQSVSAAALHEFGFTTYYHGDIFYYPIPTGGELYQYFLTMSEETPSRETMISAMDLAGVDRAYFVVNEYWWDAEAIIEQTKQLTQNWFAVGDGAVTIFVFER
ncbi:MAG: hypothetical protein WC730_03300 [Patescibacteria group bacterium]|jgi:hypothetical protein